MAEHMEERPCRKILSRAPFGDAIPLLLVQPGCG
jgi:hypothetical protein